MNTFRFTFYRHAGHDDYRPLQQVRIQAATSREAWATFEALYRPKRFTAFAVVQETPFAS